MKLVDSGYVTKYDSLADAIRGCQGKDIVLSKIALITSTTKQGTLKHRLILDCRVSGSNSATRKWERILLPKVSDVLADAMLLKALHENSDNTITFYVCDFSDAFFAVPLNPAERRYFAEGKVYVWNRVTQGSLDGPTLYGRLAALVGRLTQSL